MYIPQMDYAEFRQLVMRAGLTLTEFSDLLSMNRKSITNYAASGVVPMHLAVIATLIGSMADNKLDFRHVLKSMDIRKKKPRGALRRSTTSETNSMDRK